MIKVTEVSRQRRWQLKKLKAGLCASCGRRPLFKSERCESCYYKQLVSVKVWHWKHRRKHLKYMVKYRAKHRKYFCKYMQNYNKVNGEHLRKYQQDHYKEHCAAAV